MGKRFGLVVYLVGLGLIIAGVTWALMLSDDLMRGLGGDRASTLMPLWLVIAGAVSAVGAGVVTWWSP